MTLSSDHHCMNRPPKHPTLRRWCEKFKASKSSDNSDVNSQERPHPTFKTATGLIPLVKHAQGLPGEKNVMKRPEGIVN
jgi:hypothetical protein